MLFRSGENLPTLCGSRRSLSAAALAAAPPGEQKVMLRDHLLSEVQRLQPTQAEQVVDVLIHADNTHLLDLLRSKEKLKDEVDHLLRHHRSLIGNTSGKHLPAKADAPQGGALTSAPGSVVPVLPASSSSSSSSRRPLEVVEEEEVSLDDDPEEDVIDGRRDLRAEAKSVVP